MRHWALVFRETLATFDEPNEMTDELLKMAVGWRNLALASEARTRNQKKNAAPSLATENRATVTASTDSLAKFVRTVNC